LRLSPSSSRQMPDGPRSSRMDLPFLPHPFAAGWSP
jgi:hypothetical protein